MYTKIKNVQIIVALLKQHGIKHIVLSAGTRHVPLAHSVENDDFFECYSVVDERSAGYFALGLAKVLNEPVAIACTSSTATCNYTPPIAEAYYQNIPLLVLTGDRDPYRLGQLEDQMIDQVDMFKNFCKKCVNLPIVNNDYDTWYCQRLVNEAILELRHRGDGPVQINFPINQTIQDIADASVEQLPDYNVINRLDPMSPDKGWEDKLNELKSYKRILIICGSNDPLKPEVEKALSNFALRFNCVFATELLSNIHCEYSLDTYLLAQAVGGNMLRQTEPDLIIMFGGNYVSRLKILLRGYKDCKSWYVSEGGDIVDPLQNLNTVFECSIHYFFRYFADRGGRGKNNEELFKIYKNILEQIELPDIKALAGHSNKFAIKDAKFKNQPIPQDSELVDDNYLSSFYAFHELSKLIPNDSIVHLSILNSVRMMSMFPLDKSVTTYCNIGTDGIDGPLSTFLGHAAGTDKPCYLVVGDLGFFYDMNAMGIDLRKSNIHILLVNNGGGAEFYFSMGQKMLPNIDLHIAASHSKKAEEWVKANNYNYMSASNVDEFDRQIDEFAKSEGPVFFELFTDKTNDIKVFKTYVRMIHIDTPIGKVTSKIGNIPLVKKMAQTETGSKIKDKIKGVLK